MSEWDVPGYDVLQLLGFGTSGEVWRARERASGSIVVLRRLAGGDRAAVAAVKARATVVRSLPTPHLVRLRTTTRSGRDDVLVLDHAAGGSLASLLLRRGCLEPGEVVTAVAPLAEALGQAHAHDLVHGRLRAASVLLDSHGKPLLDGLGMAALHDPEDGLDPTGAPGGPADVWALGALAHLLLTGQEPVPGQEPGSPEPGKPALVTLAPRAPLPLVRAIEAALGIDPTTRPGAADLAVALLASCPPLPLEGVVAELEPPPGPARLGLPAPARRKALAGAGAGLALAAVVAVGWSWGRQAAEPATQVPVATVARPALAAQAWREVLERLDGARAQAFSHADAGRLDEVYVPGSPAAAADRAVLARLRGVSRSALGVEHEVTAVTTLTVSSTRAELRVVEALGVVEVLDGAGRVVGSHPAGRPRTHRVVLLSTPRGWRIQEVQAVA